MPAQRAVEFEHPFTAAGQSAGVEIRGAFNMEIRGGVGTVQLEKSYDEGAAWAVVSKDVDGNAASYAITASPGAVNLMVEEPEPGVQYRFNCTAYTSGTISCRLSR